MKTKKIKFVLPVFAILLAVGFAFSTESKVVERDAYYNIPGTANWEKTTVGEECFTLGAIKCEFFGHQLYSAPNSGSMELSKP